MKEDLIFIAVIAPVFVFYPHPLQVGEDIENTIFSPLQYSFVLYEVGFHQSRAIRGVLSEEFWLKFWAPFWKLDPHLISPSVRFQFHSSTNDIICLIQNLLIEHFSHVKSYRRKRPPWEVRVCNLTFFWYRNKLAGFILKCVLE